ncbi:hypothetical protein [Jannaschia sp. R86511]|uniref:hypothetical protein n=1 Tax=Jannaschia sp. R86511 TaxID=3093853 RepID=UPI0036D2E3A2
MTKHLVRFQSAMNSRLRGDAGQGALEYIGILIIIGIVVAAVLVVFGEQQGNINTAITTAISDFLNT